VISWGRRIAATAAVLAVLAGSPARADSPSDPGTEEGSPATQLQEQRSAVEEYGIRVFDVFPIRTLSACATVVGFGAFIVSLPLVGPVGRMEGIRSSWDYFVVAPVEYTFVRPLGDF
jgi:hypothetical protein